MGINENYGLNCPADKQKTCMGALRNFSREGENPPTPKKLTIFRRTDEKNDHFYFAPKAQPNI